MAPGKPDQHQVDDLVGAAMGAKAPESRPSVTALTNGARQRAQPSSL